MNPESKLLGLFNVKFTEYAKYQYLPIKLPGGEFVIEKRLLPFHKLISMCLDDISIYHGNTYIDDKYVYLTVKSEYQRGKAFNRAGWHIDGFGTNDINYIWSNIQPTVFNFSHFTLSSNEEESMYEMTEQAKPINDYTYPNNALVRADDSVHRVGDLVEGHRVFFKLTVSKDLFNALGNSINHELEYDRPNKKRGKERNVCAL